MGYGGGIRDEGRHFFQSWFHMERQTWSHENQVVLLTIRGGHMGQH